MKTAFCFSGELRSINNTYEPICNKIMRKFSNYDIFYHTWVDDPHLHNLKYLAEDPNMKDIHLEERKTLDEKNYGVYKRGEVLVQGMLRQLYSIKQCNKLKSNYEIQNNFKYDIVVRIRPDIIVVNDTSIEDDVELWDMSGKFYTADHDDWFGYNDRFYFGGSEDMDFLSDRLDFLDHYKSSGGITHYETFLKFCVEYRGLSVGRTGLQFMLLRPDGSRASELHTG